MRAYYLDGNNIDWIIGVCLFLFVIGIVVALAMFIIPERVDLRFCRGNILLSGVFTTVVAFAMLVVFIGQSFTLDDLETGRHWKDDCHLLEVNIPTGTFTDSINKLDCAGVIINIPKVQYDEYIRQWERYKAKNK